MAIDIKSKKNIVDKYSSILSFKNRLIAIMSPIKITMLGENLERQGRIVSV